MPKHRVFCTKPICSFCQTKVSVKLQFNQSHTHLLTINNVILSSIVENDLTMLLMGCDNRSKILFVSPFSQFLFIKNTKFFYSVWLCPKKFVLLKKITCSKNACLITKIILLKLHSTALKSFF